MPSKTQISLNGESQQPWFWIYAKGSDAQPTRYKDLADLTSALGKTDFETLVLYAAPAAVVAAALAQGQSAAQALADWSAQCATLLAVQQRFRRHMVVMEQPETADARKDAETALANRLPDMAVPEAALWGGSDAQYLALAGLAIGRSPHALALVDRLQAASLGPYGDLPKGQPLVETLLNGHRTVLRQQAAETDRAAKNARSFEDAAARVKQGAAQIVALEAQSTTAQAAAADRAADLSAQLETAASQVAALEAKIVSLQKHDAQKAQDGCAQQRVAKQAESVMIQQIVALEQALKTVHADHSQSQIERRQLDHSYRQKLEKLMGKLDAVHRSTTWRVMGPARSVIRRIRR